jgi:hypothetical protein
LGGWLRGRIAFEELHDVVGAAFHSLDEVGQGRVDLVLEVLVFLLLNDEIANSQNSE